MYSKKAILWNQEEKCGAYLVPHKREVSISDLISEKECRDDYDLGYRNPRYYKCLSDKHYLWFCKALWGMVKRGEAKYQSGVGNYTVFLIF